MGTERAWKALRGAISRKPDSWSLEALFGPQDVKTTGECLELCPVDDDVRAARAAVMEEIDRAVNHETVFHVERSARVRIIEDRGGVA